MRCRSEQEARLSRYRERDQALRPLLGRQEERTGRQVGRMRRPAYPLNSLGGRVLAYRQTTCLGGRAEGARGADRMRERVSLLNRGKGCARRKMPLAVDLDSVAPRARRDQVARLVGRRLKQDGYAGQDRCARRTRAEPARPASQPREHADRARRSLPRPSRRTRATPSSRYRGRSLAASSLSARSGCLARTRVLTRVSPTESADIGAGRARRGCRRVLVTWFLADTPGRP